MTKEHGQDSWNEKDSISSAQSVSENQVSILRRSAEQQYAAELEVLIGLPVATDALLPRNEYNH